MTHRALVLDGHLPRVSARSPNKCASYQGSGADSDTADMLLPMYCLPGSDERTSGTRKGSFGRVIELPSVHRARTGSGHAVQCWTLYWHAHGRAVIGHAVVVTDVREAQELAQYDSGMRLAFAEVTVGDDRVLAVTRWPLSRKGGIRR